MEFARQVKSSMAGYATKTEMNHLRENFKRLDRREENRTRFPWPEGPKSREGSQALRPSQSVPRPTQTPLKTLLQALWSHGRLIVRSRKRLRFLDELRSPKRTLRTCSWKGKAAKRAPPPQELREVDEELSSEDSVSDHEEDSAGRNRRS